LQLGSANEKFRPTLSNTSDKEIIFGLAVVCVQDNLKMAIDFIENFGCCGHDAKKFAISSGDPTFL